MSLKYLYKYKRFDRLSIQIFTKSELYFAKAEELNDPYEISLPTTFEGTDDEIKAKLQILNIPITDENLNEIKTPNSKLRIKLEKQSKENIQEARKTFGICSFSQVNNDILMWSHYSDCHKGFCLEFDATSSFFNDKKSNSPLYQKVNYPEIIPSNSYFRNTIEESVLASFLNKYSGWSYEKEWRLFGEPGCHTFEPHCLTGVIFGCRMHEHEKNAIRKLTAKWESPLRFYEINTKLKGKFLLKIEQL